MLSILPERLQQALNRNRAGNFNLFVFAAGYVRDEIAGRITAAKDLHASGERSLVQRIGSFQRWTAVDHTSLENHSGDVLNFT